MFYIHSLFSVREGSYGRSRLNESLQDFLRRVMESGPLEVSSSLTDLVIWEDGLRVVGVLKYTTSGLKFFTLKESDDHARTSETDTRSA